MKAFRIIAGLVFCCLLFVAGCGSGSAGKVGTITVTGSGTSSTDTTSRVSFTLTYTHPTASSVGGLEYSYSVYIDGVLQETVTENMNDNGTGTFTETISYDIVKSPAQQSVRFVATTDNLVSSDSVTVVALGVLEIQPLTQTFTATDLIGSSKSYTVSGGQHIDPYIVDIEQSPAGLVSVVTGTSAITLTRATNSAGTVTITVTDNLGSSVQAQAILQAVP